MLIDILTSDKQKTSAWAGGITRELLIFPPTASYQARDFFVRVSCAVVELASSDFSELPGFIRYIMPLSGNMKLEHSSKNAELIAKVNLAPFDVHRFDGGWTTVSYGACTDFNLMLAEGWDGEIMPLKSSSIVTCEHDQLLSIFCLKPLSIKVRGDSYKLLAGDSFYADMTSGTEGITLSVDGGENEIAVLAKAWKA